LPSLGGVEHALALLVVSRPVLGLTLQPLESLGAFDLGLLGERLMNVGVVKSYFLRRAAVIVRDPAAASPSPSTRP
jgi:hypothetical protein